jgi:hypothetical protein
MGDDALIYVIGMLEIAAEATDEQSYASWHAIADILCKEEGRELFGKGGWIFSGRRSRSA